jgi:hypothetical protein
MSGRMEWKLRCAVGLAAGAFILGAAALTALMAQVGPLMWTPVMGLATSHDAISFRMLEGASTPATQAAATAQIERALALSPYDNQARLRLVYIDARRHPHISPAGVARFEESYSLMPYDYSVAAWRIRFGLEHWASLTPQLRSEIFTEAMAFGRAHSQDVEVRRILQSIHDPQGRLAAALWLPLLNQ